MADLVPADAPDQLYDAMAALKPPLSVRRVEDLADAALTVVRCWVADHEPASPTVEPTPMPRHLERLAYSAALTNPAVMALFGGRHLDVRSVVRVALGGIAVHLAARDAALDQAHVEIERLGQLADARGHANVRLRQKLAAALEVANGPQLIAEDVHAERTADAASGSEVNR